MIQIATSNPNPCPNLQTCISHLFAMLPNGYLTF